MTYYDYHCYYWDNLGLSVGLLRLPLLLSWGNLELSVGPLIRQVLSQSFLTPSCHGWIVIGTEVPCRSSSAPFCGRFACVRLSLWAFARLVKLLLRRKACHVVRSRPTQAIALGVPSFGRYFPSLQTSNLFGCSIFGLPSLGGSLVGWFTAWPRFRIFSVGG